MVSKKNILFLSYDGLADQLANSQIFPYLNILKNFFNVFILTCEKKNNLDKLPKIKKELNKKSIKYFYLFFSKKHYFVIIYRLFDSIKIFINLITIIKKNKINYIHARGHIPAYICLFISYFFKIKYIFDFRGLWVEERIDNFSLNANSIIGKKIYQILKFFEKKSLSNSYKIIVLTEKLKNELIFIHSIKSENIFVIPCYVNVDFFKKKSNDTKLNIYKELKIPKNSKIICYLGSIGGFYLIDEMLSFFSDLKKKYDEYYFLIITKNIKELNSHLNKIEDSNIKTSILVRNIEYEKVPEYLSKTNLSICFIKNSYARLGTFPIKFGESLSLGIPIICNTGIGDLETYFDQCNIGRCVNLKDKLALKEILNNINKIEDLDKDSIINFAIKKLSIKIAYGKYKKLYEHIL